MTTALDKLKRLSGHTKEVPLKNTNESFLERLAMYKEIEERFQSILNSSKEGYFEINFKAAFPCCSLIWKEMT